MRFNMWLTNQKIPLLLCSYCLNFFLIGAARHQQYLSDHYIFNTNNYHLGIALCSLFTLIAFTTEIGAKQSFKRAFNYVLWAAFIVFATFIVSMTQYLEYFLLGLISTSLAILLLTNSGHAELSEKPDAAANEPINNPINNTVHNTAEQPVGVVSMSSVAIVPPAADAVSLSYAKPVGNIIEETAPQAAAEPALNVAQIQAQPSEEAPVDTPADEPEDYIIDEPLDEQYEDDPMQSGIAPASDDFVDSSIAQLLTQPEEVPAPPSEEEIMSVFATTYQVTDKEQEVLEYAIGSDITTKNMAAELHISERVCQRYLTSLYGKTDSNSRIDLILKYHAFREEMLNANK